MASIGACWGVSERGGKTSARIGIGIASALIVRGYLLFAAPIPRYILSPYKTERELGDYTSQ